MSRFWSPFKKPPASPPEPLEAAAPLRQTQTPEARSVPAKPVRRAAGLSLASQVGQGMDGLKREHGITGLAKIVGVTPNTMVRCLSGVGLKLSTLEQMCQKLGWSVTVTDTEGKIVAKV